MPWLRKNRQSASLWFQCASLESASPADASSRLSSTIAGSSVAAIAHLVFGGLAEVRHRPRNPVGRPRNQLVGVDDRQPKQFHGLRGVGQPGGRLLLADDDRRTAEALAEFGGEIAHRQNLVTADIDMTEAEVDRLA